MDKTREEALKYLDSVMGLEEFYSVEDYSIYLLAKTGINTQCNNSSKKIRFMCQNDSNKNNEEVVFQCNLEKIFQHIKIYAPNKENFIPFF